MRRRALEINLKISLVIILAVIMVVIGFLGPELGQQIRVLYPYLAYLYLPCLIYMWVTALPLVSSVILAWLIVTQVGRNNTYCVENSARLMVISRLILADVVLYSVALMIIVFGGLFHPAMYLFITLIIFCAALLSAVASAASHYIIRYREKNNIK